MEIPQKAYLFAVIKTARFVKTKRSGTTHQNEISGVDKNWKKIVVTKIENEIFVATKIERKIFVEPKIFCRGQKFFVGTKILDEFFVVTKKFGLDEKLGEENEKGYYVKKPLLQSNTLKWNKSLVFESV